ncbi:MAG: EAL domain-containing protein, partial [bacterium]
MPKGTLAPKLSPGSFDLEELIETELVETHFQPILSLQRKCVVGYEGLSRGLHPMDGSLIPPGFLFAEAEAKGLQLSLDRLCRKKALETFPRIPGGTSDLILSVNLDASVMDQGAAGSGYLRRQVLEAGLNPRNIAIEIIESNVGDLDELRKFVQTYRDYGFLIALDDVGAGHSNLNRIPLIKPDILKIDRYLIQGVQDDFYKQEVLKSLLSMARCLGTLIIAEGVETEAEGLALLSMGVDMVQGYFFARPAPPQRVSRANGLDQVERLGTAFKEKQIRKIDQKRFRMDNYRSMVSSLRTGLEKSPVDRFDLLLAQMASGFPEAEGIYVLDEEGFQVTDTILTAPDAGRRNPVMFYPALKGSDHRLREYFYFLVETDLGKGQFVTTPYLSTASGKVCVTLSTIFHGTDQKKYVLCVDVATAGLL